MQLPAVLRILLAERIPLRRTSHGCGRKPDLLAGRRKHGENLAALKFIRTMNQGLKERVPECRFLQKILPLTRVLLRLSGRADLALTTNGIFGWMHDTLSYFQADANERREKYHKLTFSMMYYYNERYILPLSHDEVVHGKATIAQKMNGGIRRQIPSGKSLLHVYVCTSRRKAELHGK